MDVSFDIDDGGNLRPKFNMKKVNPAQLPAVMKQAQELQTQFAPPPPVPEPGTETAAQAAGRVARMPQSQRAQVREALAGQSGNLAFLGLQDQVMADMAVPAASAAPASPPAAPAIVPGVTISNPKTGQRMRYTGQGWEPIR